MIKKIKYRKINLLIKVFYFKYHKFIKIFKQNQKILLNKVINFFRDKPILLFNFKFNKKKKNLLYI